MIKEVKGLMNLIGERRNIDVYYLVLVVLFRLCLFLRRQCRAVESTEDSLLYRYVSDVGCAFLRDNLESELGVGGVDSCRERNLGGEGVGLACGVGG